MGHLYARESVVLHGIHWLCQLRNGKGLGLLQSLGFSLGQSLGAQEMSREPEKCLWCTEGVEAWETSKRGPGEGTPPLGSPSSGLLPHPSRPPCSLHEARPMLPECIAAVPRDQRFHLILLGCPTSSCFFGLTDWALGPGTTLSLAECDEPSAWLVPQVS